MKQSILFLFLLFVPFLSWVSTAAAQGQYLPAAELTRILSDRTFIMTYSEEKQKNNHVYFAQDGRYTILFPPGNIRSTDKWNTDENDNLCLRHARRSGGSTNYITRCGKVSLAGANALILYNDKGEQINTLQFLGNGNLLEQFAK